MARCWKTICWAAIGLVVLSSPVAAEESTAKDSLAPVTTPSANSSQCLSGQCCDGCPLLAGLTQLLMPALGLGHAWSEEAPVWQVAPVAPAPSSRPARVAAAPAACTQVAVPMLDKLPYPCRLFKNSGKYASASKSAATCVSDCPGQCASACQTEGAHSTSPGTALTFTFSPRPPADCESARCESARCESDRCESEPCAADRCAADRCAVDRCAAAHGTKPSCPQVAAGECVCPGASQQRVPAAQGWAVLNQVPPAPCASGSCQPCGQPAVAAWQALIPAWDRPLAVGVEAWQSPVTHPVPVVAAAPATVVAPDAGVFIIGSRVIRPATPQMAVAPPARDPHHRPTPHAPPAYAAPHPYPQPNGPHHPPNFQAAPRPVQPAQQAFRPQADDAEPTREQLIRENAEAKVYVEAMEELAEQAVENAGLEAKLEMARAEAKVYAEAMQQLTKQAVENARLEAKLEMAEKVYELALENARQQAKLESMEAMLPLAAAQAEWNAERKAAQTQIEKLTQQVHQLQQQLAAQTPTAPASPYSSTPRYSSGPQYGVPNQTSVVPGTAYYSPYASPHPNRGPQYTPGSPVPATATRPPASNPYGYPAQPSPRVTTTPANENESGQQRTPEVDAN